MTLFNVILFLIWAGIAFLVLKFRVHIHVHYELRRVSSVTAKQGRRATPVASGEAAKQGPQALSHQVNVLEELTATLQSLGCKRSQALNAARKAVEKGRGSNFTDLLRLAVKEAA